MKSHLLPLAVGAFVRWSLSGFKGTYREAEDRFGRSVFTYVLGFVTIGLLLFVVLLVIGDN